MGEVVEIEDHKPHVGIEGLKKYHVMPRSLLEALADGSVSISDAEESNDYLPTIIQEWLDNN